LSKQRIGEASLIIAGGSIAVNVLQVLKLMIVSAWFGASSGELDQYFIALLVPLAFQGVVMGALQASFIPYYVGFVARGEGEKAQRALGNTFAFGVFFYLVLCIGLYFCANPLVFAASGGAMSGKALALNVSFFHLILIMVFFSALSDLVTAFYNANQRYFLPVLAPLSAILVSIVYLVVFRSQGIYALVYGLVWGSVAQFAILLPGTRRFGGFSLGFSAGFLKKEYVPVYLMMVPVGAALTMGHLNLLVGQAVASSLGEGNVSIWGYATRLHDVVTKIAVLSVGGALLPFLSQYASERRFQELRSTVGLGIRLAFLTLLPASLLVLALGPETVSVVLQRKEFTAFDSRSVGYTWAACSTSLFFIAATVFQSRALNALKHLHSLWIPAVCGFPLNLALVYGLSRIWGVTGIALGTSLIYAFYVVFYGIRLRSWHRQTGTSKPLLTPFWKSLAAVAGFGVVLFALRHLSLPWIGVVDTPTPERRLFSVIAMATIVFCSAILYLTSLKLLHVSEAGLLIRFFKRALRLGKG
jgi:putative peptidoglycan lipid II flippase